MKVLTQRNTDNPDTLVAFTPADLAALSTMRSVALGLLAVDEADVTHRVLAGDILERLARVQAVKSGAVRCKP